MGPLVVTVQTVPCLVQIPLHLPPQPLLAPHVLPEHEGVHGQAGHWIVPPHPLETVPHTPKQLVRGKQTHWPELQMPRLQPPQSSVPPQPSLVVPQWTPSAAQVDGWQAGAHCRLRLLPAASAATITVPPPTPLAQL